VALLGALIALAATPAARAAGPCASAPNAGALRIHLSFEGQSRFVLVHVPPGLEADHPVPLVLALHGAGGSGSKMETYSGFSGLADQHRFLVAYPNAAGPTWNSAADPAKSHDVAFISDLIAHLRQTLCIDSRRIYATGVSNGGGMVAVLGCALSTQLAAIAPVAGNYDVDPPCHAKRPVSVLEIHGTGDRIAPYANAGRSPGPNVMPPFVLGWVRRDGCGSRSAERKFATRTFLYVWGRCKQDVTVVHVRITGGTHQWPGAKPPDPGPPSTFCAACVIWSFFSEVSLGTAARSDSGGAGLPL
jgi:polyhydroxybutyrate depolymerase